MSKTTSSETPKESPPPAQESASTDRSRPANATEATAQVKAEIERFLDREVEQAYQIATLEVREEGIRWKTILEQLGHTIQGVAENTTNARDITVASTMRILINRVEELERRMDAVTTDLNANLPHGFPPEQIPPPNEPQPPININAKGILQDRCLMNGFEAPTYNLVRREGTPDSPVFCSGCTVQERGITTTGIGRTMRASHQSAAHAMLLRLEWPTEFPTTTEREALRMQRERLAEMED